MSVFTPRLFRWIITAALFGAGQLCAEQDRPRAMPDMVKHPHPRLFLPAAAVDAVREKVASDPAAAALHREVMREAEDILTERTCRYEIPDGRRLLRESRRALHHIVQAGMAWRLSGEERFRLRVITEMDAACGLKDWNTSHFLDTAEMAAAVAIGYDWLHATLSAEQRKRYEDALIGKALRPAKKGYDGNIWWSRVRNNWSQVCGAGIGLAAIAVWEREPDLCEDLLRSGVVLVERCGKFYRPDGVYAEGPGYWHYGTNYQVLLLAACESLGMKVEVEPTLEKSGDFMLEVIGPSGGYFNFADMPMSRAKVSPAQLWVARHFGNSGQAEALRDVLVEDPHSASAGRLASLGLLWMPPAPTPGERSFRKLHTFDGEQPMAFLRNGRQADSAWLAIKGGTGAVSHGHLDAGSFVYEAGGVRWFVDLGSDNYNLPGYFRERRWEYFRLNNRSHNTLEIGGRLQRDPEEPCRLRDSSEREGWPWVEIDLGRAYKGQAESVVRRAEMDMKNGAVRLIDTIEQPRGAVRWVAVTDAKAELVDGAVMLRKDGQTLILRSESEGAWKVEAAKPPTEQEKQNKGYSLLSFTAPQADRVLLKVEWSLVAN